MNLPEICSRYLGGHNLVPAQCTFDGIDLILAFIPIIVCRCLWCFWKYSSSCFCDAFVWKM